MSPRSTRGSYAAALCIFSAALSSAFFWAPNAHADDAPISEEARNHFKAGVSYLQDPDGERVEDAYREFKAAFAISNSPKILGNIAFCAMRLERDGEAIDGYSRYLREVADIDPEERAQIVRDVQTMTVGVTRLTLVIDEIEARVTDVRTPVKGEKITNAYGPVRGKIDIGIRPGNHIITVKLQGYDDIVWELDAHAGAHETHNFQMKKTPPPQVAFGSRGAHRTSPYPWVVAGVGAAMLATGTVTGIVALKKTSTISNRCPNDTCPPGYNLDADRSSARTFVRVTDVLLIGGAVVTGAGLTWLLLGSGDEEQAPAKPAPAVGALCTGQGCLGSLRVAF